MHVQLVGWLLVCLTVAWASRRWPAQTLLVPLALYVALPTLAAQLLTGIRYDDSVGIPALHPATWMLMLMTAAQLTSRRNAAALVDATVRSRPWWTGAVTAVVGWALVMAVLNRGGYSQILEILVAPALVVALVASTQRLEPRLGDWLRDGVRWTALGLAALAVLQFVLRNDLIYGHFYSDTIWSRFYAENGYRATTTLGQPLITALVLVPSFVWIWHRPVQRVPAWLQRLLLLGGVASTGSRVGLLLVLAYASGAVIAEVRAGRRYSRKAVLVAVVGTAAMAALAAPVVLQRLVSSGGDGSAAYRFEALGGFSERFAGYIFTGAGPGASYALGVQWIQDIHGLENPLLQMSVELGILATTLWYVAWATLGLRRRGGGWPWGIPQRSVALGFAMAVTFSSIGAKGAAATLLAVFVALSLLDLATPAQNAEDLDPELETTAGNVQNDE